MCRRGRLRGWRVWRRGVWWRGMRRRLAALPIAGDRSMNATHEVFNQPRPLVDYNAFEGNRGLRDALKFNAPQLDTGELSRLGALAGSAEMQAHARLANIHA